MGTYWNKCDDCGKETIVTDVDFEHDDGTIDVEKLCGSCLRDDNEFTDDQYMNAATQVVELMDELLGLQDSVIITYHHQNKLFRFVEHILVSRL